MLNRSSNPKNRCSHRRVPRRASSLGEGARPVGRALERGGSECAVGAGAIIGAGPNSPSP
ncbi:hypothetical protein ACFFX0_31040 [Citricoccus parietis]|uniref:Uncharacterized protein n=1 Tax=Citricoccus parietis TaxID=592307 RepID=A0ABV5G8U5_9MICC